MMSSGGQVQIEHVSKRFGETVALDDCSLTIVPGEVHAIVGENGSGKSTLAKIMAGVIRPDSGAVSVFGHEPRSPMEARARGVAMIFQEVLVAESLSVADNIFAGTDTLWKRSRTRAETRRQSRELLRRFCGVDVDPDTPVQNLPLSIKQWIVIARALVSRPRLLILDESSAALDLDATARLHAEIRTLRDGGCCVVLVTHRIAELVRIADRATVLRDGRVVDELVGGDINEANLLRMMSARAVVPGAKASDMRAVTRVAGDVVLAASDLAVEPDAPAFDVDLCAGEIVGVTGLDGQGHGEFVRIVAGLRPAPAGRILLGAGGSGLVQANSQDLGREVAYISGDRAHDGIFPNLSIFENFALPLYRRSFGEVGWIRRPPLQRAFDAEVRRLSIKTGPASNLITSLSGGNQQKILIGRVLAMGPRIIVLDDPARGVDAGTKRELYVQLRKFADQGGAVIYLSSEIEEFFDFADRALVFRNQTLFRSIAAAGFSEQAFLAAMFGKPEQTELSAMHEGAA